MVKILCSSWLWEKTSRNSALVVVIVCCLSVHMFILLHGDVAGFTGYRWWTQKGARIFVHVAAAPASLKLKAHWSQAVTRSGVGFLRRCRSWWQNRFICCNLIVALKASLYCWGANSGSTDFKTTETTPLRLTDIFLPQIMSCLPECVLSVTSTALRGGWGTSKNNSCDSLFRQKVLGKFHFLLAGKMTAGEERKVQFEVGFEFRWGTKSSPEFWL